MSQQITLSPAEVAFALTVATQRDATKRNRNARLSRKHTGFAVHFAGVIGELCFRKAYRATIDLTVRPMGDNHQADAVLPDGRKVEVKASLFGGATPELKFESDEMDFEHCCLVQVTLPDQGKVFPVMAKAEMVFEQKDYGYGMRYVYRPE